MTRLGDYLIRFLGTLLLLLSLVIAGALLGYSIGLVELQVGVKLVWLMFGICIVFGFGVSRYAAPAGFAAFLRRCAIVALCFGVVAVTGFLCTALLGWLQLVSPTTLFALVATAGALGIGGILPLGWLRQTKNTKAGN
jgi:hypothetical protein